MEIETTKDIERLLTGAETLSTRVGWYHVSSDLKLEVSFNIKNSTEKLSFLNNKLDLNYGSIYRSISNDDGDVYDFTIYDIGWSIRINISYHIAEVHRSANTKQYSSIEFIGKGKIERFLSFIISIIRINNSDYTQYLPQIYESLVKNCVDTDTGLSFLSLIVKLFKKAVKKEFGDEAFLYLETSQL